MATVQITITDPKINIKKHNNNCRCVELVIKTVHKETVVLDFKTIDDARAFHGILGFALDAK